MIFPSSLYFRKSQMVGPNFFGATILICFLSLVRCGRDVYGFRMESGESDGCDVPSDMKLNKGGDVVTQVKKQRVIKDEMKDEVFINNIYCVFKNADWSFMLTKPDGPIICLSREGGLGSRQRPG